MILGERFDEALVYAARLHATQLRKGRPVPVMAHLLGVTSLVLEHGGSEEEAIAALLHDAIEDQGGDSIRAEIRRRFGENVLSIIEGCTDTDRFPKPPWRPRKEAFLARLAAASPSVHLVTAADKLHNARALLEDYRSQGERVWEHFSGRKEGSLWYYRSVSAILAECFPSPLVDELQRVVASMEEAIAIS